MILKTPTVDEVEHVTDVKHQITPDTGITEMAQVEQTLNTHPKNFGPVLGRNLVWQSVLDGNIDPWKLGEYGDGLECPTVKELEIISLLNCILKKVNWWHKCQDESIVSKWRAEASEQGITEESLMDYVIAEVRYYAGLVTPHGRPSPVVGVWEADHVIPTELKQDLIDDLTRMEKFSSYGPDWHPGSDEQVLDLVHPSLYPLVYGVTRIIPEHQFINVDGTPRYDPMNINDLARGHACSVVAEPKDIPQRYSQDDYFKSKHYQWLPSEVSVHHDHCKFTSYINNVHPQRDHALYVTLEKILFKFMPMFSSVLTDACQGHIDRWPDHVRAYDQLNPSNYPSDIEDDDEAYEAWHYRERVIPPFDVKFDADLRNTVVQKINLVPESGSITQLQVIVKAASIHLTPDKPSYNGGSWHVEGMENERIVSTGLYYYDQENITESRLGFRITRTEPPYEQGDNPGVMAMYGLEDEAPLSLDIGNVTTCTDRLIAFPNHMQHQVQPFELQDKTKCGYRNILAFFLVDPTKNIVSTRNVIPQNADWMTKVDQLGPYSTRASSATIYQYLGGTYDMNTAKEHRERLMKERSAFVATSDTEYFSREFSLCEH